jgi:pyruvate dehydrogenase E1 component alpha subunit
MRAPAVLFCQNNGWAISTPRSRQTAAETIASRAAGYGMPGVLVDGNDLFAVYEVTREALDRARNGGGPTLIEAVTYRYGSHTTADDATRYRPAQELEDARRRDPIERFERYLAGRGLWDASTEAQADEWAARVIDEAVDEAEARGFAGPDAIFENVFAERPPRLEEQRAALTGEA